jgi:hypothetical protein
MVEHIQVTSGISMPFFPPRPGTGSWIKDESDLKTIDKGKYVVQGKLNGDRCCSLTLKNKVYLQNRHGSWFKHPVENISALVKLPDCTLLDGEVKNKLFYPFEAVVVGGQSLMFKCPSIREKAAKRLCFEFGIPFIFCAENIRKCLDWEGFVLKEKGSFYLPLGSDSQETKTWWKRKWTTGSTTSF